MQGKKGMKAEGKFTRGSRKMFPGNKKKKKVRVRGGIKEETSAHSDRA